METISLFNRLVSTVRKLAYCFKLLIFSVKTGAGEGIRTLDPNLGKVVLYH